MPFGLGVDRADLAPARTNAAFLCVCPAALYHVTDTRSTAARLRSPRDVEQVAGGPLAPPARSSVRRVQGRIIGQVAALAHGGQVIEVAALDTGGVMIRTGTAPQVGGGQDHARARDGMREPRARPALR